MASETRTSIGKALDAMIEALETLAESERITVVKAVCEHLNIPFLKTSYKEQPGIEDTTASGLEIAPGGMEKITDIRTLKERKKPRNDIEMICVMGYYLEKFAPEGERKSTIQPKDVGKYFDQANFPFPKVPSQTLINTKKAGYLDSAGRGKYKLNPVGHNLVAHTLPRKKNI
jgi:hypothetical protein